MKHYPEEVEDERGGVRVLYTALDAESLGRLPPGLAGVQLPPDRRFVGTMLDTRTGQVIPFTYDYANYEGGTDSVWDGENVVEARTLHRYMMTHHFCGCHRARACGVDAGCEDNRFLVLSLTHPALPGVNLMREEAE